MATGKSSSGLLEATGVLSRSKGPVATEDESYTGERKVSSFSISHWWKNFGSLFARFVFFQVENVVLHGNRSMEKESQNRQYA